jgi:hypothetical protein
LVKFQSALSSSEHLNGLGLFGGAPTSKVMASTCMFFIEQSVVVFALDQGPVRTCFSTKYASSYFTLAAGEDGFGGKLHTLLQRWWC